MKTLDGKEPFLDWPYVVSEDLRNVINENKNKFMLVSAYCGFFGSLIYRIIAGSDESFAWDKNFNGSVEPKLKPLEWPRLTEGFLCYDDTDYKHFFENHFSTAHISMPILEQIKDLRELSFYTKSNKKLLLRSHRLDCHNYLECKIVRVCGTLENVITKSKKTKMRRNSYRSFDPIEANANHNLMIENLMSDDFDTFLQEYLELCDFLQVLPNINNVRSFILLLKEKLKRFQLTLS